MPNSDSFCVLNFMAERAVVVWIVGVDALLFKEEDDKHGVRSSSSDAVEAVSDRSESCNRNRGVRKRKLGRGAVHVSLFLGKVVRKEAFMLIAACS